MKECHFPQGKLLFNRKSFSKESLEITIDEIYKSLDRFTGYIKLEKFHEYQLFLFFLKGKVYASGKSIGCRHENILIRDFFHDLSSETASFTVSLHETDPVLLKEMLIILQREPSIRATTNLIDLEDISKGIQNDASDALIVLNKNNIYNFFFYKDGKGVMSHSADSKLESIAHLPVTEQLLSYGYPADLSTVEALVYRNISTAPAADSENLSQKELINMLYNTDDFESSGAAHVIVKKDKKYYISLIIVEGHYKGTILSASIPCIIGRKNADIQLKDRHVSRRHASIIALEGNLFIEDLDSTNGTFVNNEEIKVRELHEGDTITVGETSLKIKDINSS